MPLVTLAEADAHLRLDLETDGASPPVYIDARLPNVQMKLTQAESIILNYLKIGDLEVDGSPPSWSDRDRENVRASILLILSALFDDADGRTVADYMALNTGSVPALLMRLRDPALA